MSRKTIFDIQDEVNLIIEDLKAIRVELDRGAMVGVTDRTMRILGEEYLKAIEKLKVKLDEESDKLRKELCI